MEGPFLLLGLLHPPRLAMSHQETFLGGTALLYIYARTPVKRFLYGRLQFFVCVWRSQGGAGLSGGRGNRGR